MAKARSIHKGGTLLEGAPVKKGDVLFSRRTGIQGTVVADPRGGKVKIRSGWDSVVRTSALKSVSANYTRQRVSSWSRW